MHLADADERPGTECSAADRRAEERRLGTQVPFGMVEEGAVVDRHRAGHRRPRRHGVVRPVMDLHVERTQERGKAELFEGEPAGPRGRDGAARRRAPAASSLQRSSSPRRATSVNQRRHAHASPGRGPWCSSRRHRAGPGPPRRRARAARGPSTQELQSPMCWRAAVFHVRVARSASPRVERSARSTSSVRTALMPAAMSCDVERVDDTSRRGHRCSWRSCTLGTSLADRVGVPTASPRGGATRNPRSSGT